VGILRRQQQVAAQYCLTCTAPSIKLPALPSQDSLSQLARVFVRWART
jgi:hypothetical protein